MKSKGYAKGGMRSKGYAKGGKSKGYAKGGARGALSDAERSMKATAPKTTSRQSVSQALKVLRSAGGAMTDSERKMLEGLLNKPKKSMGGSMKTKGYAKGGPYQGQRQQYKRTGNV